MERYTPLVKTGSVSRKQLDDALQQVQETEAAIATAKAQVDEAKINLKFTTITAPFPAWPAWQLLPSATC